MFVQFYTLKFRDFEKGITGKIIPNLVLIYPFNYLTLFMVVL